MFFLSSSAFLPSLAFFLAWQEYRTALCDFVSLITAYLPGPRLSTEEVAVVCATINTGYYILERCEPLQQSIVGIVGQDFEQYIEISMVEEAVTKLNNKATKLLTAHIIQKIFPIVTALRETKQT